MKNKIKTSKSRSSGNPGYHQDFTRNASRLQEWGSGIEAACFFDMVQEIRA